jgi:hypothetical protein
MVIWRYYFESASFLMGWWAQLVRRATVQAQWNSGTADTTRDCARAVAQFSTLTTAAFELNGLLIFQRLTRSAVVRVFDVSGCCTMQPQTLPSNLKVLA